MNDTTTGPTADQIAAVTDTLTKAFIATAIGEYLDRNGTYMLDTYRDGQEIVNRMRYTTGAYNAASGGDAGLVAEYVARGAVTL